MSNIRKEDTSPATKADIALVLEKLGALAGDVSSSKTNVENLNGKFGEHQKEFATLQTAFTVLQKAFAEHDKVMHAQFETILDHIDGVVEQVCEHFDKRFKKLDDACLERFVKQEKTLRDLDRRVCVVERRVSVPS